MSPQIHLDIVIDASPSRVWEISSDFDTYPEWNPFVRRIISVGERLEVDLQPPGGRGMIMRPTVLRWSRGGSCGGSATWALVAFSTASTDSASSRWVLIGFASCKRSDSAACWRR